MDLREQLVSGGDREAGNSGQDEKGRKPRAAVAAAVAVVALLLLAAAAAGVAASGRPALRLIQDGGAANTKVRGAADAPIVGTSIGGNEAHSSEKGHVAATVAIVAATSLDPKGAADGPTEHVAASNGTASLAMAKEPNGICEEETGGTCMFLECSPLRHSSCEYGLCLCPPGTCRTFNGSCASNTTTRTPGGKWSPAWVRENVHILFWGAPIAVTLRSFGESLLFYLLAMGFQPVAQNEVRKFKFSVYGGAPPTWEEARGHLGWSTPVAFAVAVVKVPLWHLSQPFGYFALFYAYGPLMGWAQWCLAAVVLAREATYVCVVTAAVVLTPSVLLFNPMAEEDVLESIGYVLMPEKFLLFGLQDFIGVAEFFALLFATMAADFCAICALAVGLGTSLGLMWPALAAGYMMVALSAVGYFVLLFL